MLTDRFGTLVLVCIFLKEADKSEFFQNQACNFLILEIILDLCSHWLQVSNANLSGEHHKKFKNNFKTLDLYYKNKYNFMFFLCVFNEGFHIAILALLQIKNRLFIHWFLFGICFAVSLVKHFIHVLQLLSNVQKVLRKDEELNQENLVKNK